MYRHFGRSEKFLPRDSRFPHMCRAVPLSSSVFLAACALSAPTGNAIKFKEIVSYVTSCFPLRVMLLS